MTDTASGPIRVTALAASAQLGGTERVLLDFAARAFEHDIVLKVITPRDGPLLRILQEIGVPAAVVPGPDALLRGSQQAGHRWTLPLALLSLPVWASRLGKHPFWTESDLIYSVAFKGHLAAAIAGGPPGVWHLHEFPPAAFALPWRAMAGTLPRALIANSAAVGHAWERGGSGNAAAAPLTVVPNGVDLDRFKPRPRTGWIHDQLGIPRNHRLIGMPAVFARWKGQLAVIEAAREVLATVPDAHLVFVGGSIYDTVAERQYGEELRQNTGEFAIPTSPSNVHNLPNLPNLPHLHILPFQPKIELAYPEFDCVVHYSLRPEPFGRVILEGMACGVPVLAAAEGGPLEIVGGTGPGRYGCGWLVEPRRPRDLAAALKAALSLTAGERDAQGRAGRTRAEDYFSARVFARGVAQVLRSVARAHA